MKKVFVTLIIGMTFLFSGNLYAGDKKYGIRNDPGNPTPPISPNKPRTPAYSPVLAGIDSETGELTIMFNSNISSVNIYISLNGMVLENDNLDAVAGQTVTYDLSSYEVGEYTLLIEKNGDTVAAYSITIEEE